MAKLSKIEKEITTVKAELLNINKVATLIVGTNSMSVRRSKFKLIARITRWRNGPQDISCEVVIKIGSKDQYKEIRHRGLLNGNDLSEVKEFILEAMMSSK